ncbi:MAG: hypothetical protein HC923_07865, partial [Myxococcales bacterium]|nr:hypothetical protein [Myxococcales bacterium]
RIFEEAGLPAGCFNLITAQDPVPFSDTIFADERVRVDFARVYETLHPVESVAEYRR